MKTIGKVKMENDQLMLGTSALVKRHPGNVNVLSFAMSVIARRISDKLLVDKFNRELMETSRKLNSK